MSELRLHLPDELIDEIATAVAARLATDGVVPPARAREDRWRLLSVDEVAEIFGRSPRWVHDAVVKRQLPFVRIDGGGRMFDLDDVRAWARGRRVPAEGS